MSLTELIDTTMEDTNDTVDELLISTVSEETELPVKMKAAKQPAKRKAPTAPKAARPKKTEDKAPGAKRKAAAMEVHLDEEDATEITEVEPPKPKARAKKAANPKAAVEDMSDLDEIEPPKPKSRAKTTKARTTTKEPAKTTKSRVKRVVEPDDFDAEDPVPSPVNIRSNFLQGKTSKAVPKPVTAKAGKSAVKRVVKPAKRPVEEVVSEQEESEVEDIQEQAPPRKRQRTASVTQPEPVYRRRAGSVSDSERGDPMLRRKLGDITRKYENVEVKYRSLKDVAVIEANSNVEKLRKQCDAITEKSDKLIASLRKELAQQSAFAQESRKQSKDTQVHEKEVQKHEREAQKHEKEAQKHEKEASRLRTANTELSSTLTAAQNEIKALQAKLAAARATPAPEAVKQPQTTVKPAPVRSQNQAHNDRETQLKLALYADLTDLLIQNVKQTEEGDEYDCIQTGRNGSLHFKLLFDAENIAKARSSPNSTELEFLYRPQIHADRDKELISILPDYLTEELTFERGVASKFYARVVNKLDEKIVVEEDEEGED